MSLYILAVSMSRHNQGMLRVLCTSLQVQLLLHLHDSVWNLRITFLLKSSNGMAQSAGRVSLGTRGAFPESLLLPPPPPPPLEEYPWSIMYARQTCASPLPLPHYMILSPLEPPSTSMVFRYKWTLVTYMQLGLHGLRSGGKQLSLLDLHVQNTTCIMSQLC